MDFLAQLRYCKGWLPAAGGPPLDHFGPHEHRVGHHRRRGVELSQRGKWVRATATPHSKPDWEATVLRRHDNDIHLAAQELVDTRKLGAAGRLAEPAEWRLPLGPRVGVGVGDGGARLGKQEQLAREELALQF